MVAASPRSPRSRGCLLAIALLLVVVAVAGVLVALAFASPDLGAPPGGSDDGDSERAVAAAVGSRLVAELAAGPHAVVALSEHDLTVLVRDKNPNPTRFQDPQVRVRDGLVVVDALTSVGPFTLHAVGRVELELTTASGGQPSVGARITSVQVGNLGLPDFAARAVQDRIAKAFDLQDLLSADERLSLARSLLDCVGVSGGAVRLGFHRPSVPAARDDCA
jgi:hypothetical protein